MLWLQDFFKASFKKTTLFFIMFPLSEPEFKVSEQFSQIDQQFFSRSSISQIFLHPCAIPQKDHET